jgi:hypothetical protein
MRKNQRKNAGRIISNMRNKLRYGCIATALLSVLTTTGCVQYDFVSNIDTYETYTYTETHAETVTSNVSLSGDNSDKTDEPSISHNISSDDSTEPQQPVAPENKPAEIVAAPKANTANALSYPDGNYTVITSDYLSAVFDTINSVRAGYGLTPLSQYSAYTTDADIYAANEAAYSKFISENTNNSATIASCMSSRTSEKSICSSVSSMLSSRPGVLNASSMSVGIATNSSTGYAYVCIFFN